jgi:hypothetical protein
MEQPAENETICWELMTFTPAKRGGRQIHHAVCADQDTRTAKWSGASSHAALVYWAADLGDQRDQSHCAEFGIVAPVGRRGVEELLNVIANANGKQVRKVANGNRSIQDDLGRYLLERSSVTLHWSAVSFTSPTNLFVNSVSSPLALWHGSGNE